MHRSSFGNAWVSSFYDVRLPDESGYGLLEELKTKHPDTAVVMISGVDDPELGKAAVEHGAYAYFVKPVGATELYLAVVNAFRRRSMEIDYRANLQRLESLVAERTEQIDKAAKVQAALLPDSPLIGEGYEVAAHFAPAREISGDFYDWYLLDRGRLALTLGDVMGKGLPAAILMATVRAALRSASAHAASVEAGVEAAAGVMAAALEVNQAYVTLFHAIYDAASGEVRYIDAGHGHARNAELCEVVVHALGAVVALTGVVELQRLVECEPSGAQGADAALLGLRVVSHRGAESFLPLDLPRGAREENVIALAPAGHRLAEGTVQGFNARMVSGNSLPELCNKLPTFNVGR